MAGNVLLELQNLVVSYGKAQVVHNVDFTVNKGEIVLLLGRNGAGKSTILASIAGLIPKVEGKVTFEGKDITRSSPFQIVRSGISNVLEGHRIFGDLTVEDNLALGAFGMMRGRALAKRLDEIFELFPLINDKRQIKAGRLSGGQQQILAIAQGLVSSPRLLLIDEPSIGVAPKVVSDVLALLKVLKTGGMTVLLVEQSVQKALDIADNVYLLENGRIVCKDTPQLIRDNPLLHHVYLGRKSNSDPSARSAQPN